MSDKVSRWLAERGLAEYAPLFQENKIDLSILPELTVEDLKDMGVTAVGDRRRIMRAIAAFDDETSIHGSRPMHPTAAKRQVTVMFVDLSGFTKLSANMDVEDAHGLLNNFFVAADAIIEDFGGRIDKHIGDAVMAVFGVAVSNANDTERAARAALEIHAALAALDPPMTCHIGIASGQVIASAVGSEVHTEYTLVGDGVNLAARITDKAGPGETLISADIHLALGPRFLGDDAGEAELAGIDAPQRLWRLGGVSSGSGARRHRFVGRGRELSMFQAAFERCRDHATGEVHLVLGEPGIGKTHLSEEIAGVARGMGFAVHGAAVMDFGAREGQSAVQGLVRSLLGIGMDAAAGIAEAAVEQAGAMRWIDPSNRAHLNALLELEQDAGVAEVYANMDNVTRMRGRRAVIDELLHARSDAAPLLLQIEDIHWATPDVLSAFAHVASAIRELPCLMMMTSRIDGDPLDIEWQSQANGVYLTKIELSGLSAAQSRELTKAITEDGAEVIDAFIERAGGNPLFLEQLLRSREALAGGGLPGSIQAIVQSRLDTIGPEARAAIQAAAVLGQRLSPDALKFLLEDETLDFRVILRSGLMREAGPDLVFAHALIRDGSYESLFKAERARLHERAAEWFAGRDATLRARHLDRAQSPDAAQAYLEAATNNIRSFQFQSAEALIGRALELQVTPEVRVDLLGALSEALRLQGRTHEALAQCDEAAAQVATDAQLSRIHIERAQSARQTSQYQDALDSLDVAEAAARRSGDEQSLAQVHYLRGNIHFPLGRFDEALVSNESALRLARKLGSVRLEVGALSGFGDAYFMNGAMRTAADYYTQAVERARPDGLVRDVAANLHNLSVARSYSGDVLQGRIDGIEAVEVSRTYFALVPECVALTCVGVAHTLLDELDEALEAFATSAEVGRRVGARRLEAQALEHLARAQAHSGDLAAAERTGREAVKIALEHGPNFVGPKSLSALALALEDPDEQDRLLDQGAGIIAEGCVGHNHLHFYPDACAIMLARGEWDRALAFADALERFTEREPLPLVELTLREIRHLADAGRRQQAPAEGEEAAALRADFARMAVRRGLLGRADFVS
ncbi:adenylate/guanylate cyclase domain-containing protein [Roseibacterium sp. SDUM158017]|uniref:adenylate/guanylate cyclase domain-containing protein n=1 Tax=Roseicyclus salinarum TaxID=3036773 RepID=UPI0024154BE8|nr:adenylate/guanylate cyclase domain-containing protein [Roseibacterium sp. SDUM158017]MDG4649716.1 adenylate/guanylate cyclase domain-containing protein [Roseibacterium sp. SDUM158017]